MVATQIAMAEMLGLKVYVDGVVCPGCGAITEPEEIEWYGTCETCFLIEIGAIVIHKDGPGYAEFAEETFIDPDWKAN